jgi:hypothetical protein
MRAAGRWLVVGWLLAALVLLSMDGRLQSAPNTTVVASHMTSTLEVPRVKAATALPARIPPGGGGQQPAHGPLLAFGQDAAGAEGQGEEQEEVGHGGQK